MKLVGTGISHRTAPIELREKLAQATTPAEAALAALRSGDFGIDEACVISTCNRVEVFAAGQGGTQAIARRIRAFIEASCGFQPHEIEPHLYEHQGADGVRHLFRVASSLDSMVLGEPQILGQVKQAYRIACEAGSIGPVLGRVFERAFAVAKRVRSETGVAENAVSMSFAAVELGREIFTSLGGKNVLLIGAGKMSTLAAMHLRSNGIAEIRVANRSIERATQLAQEIGGTASTLSDLELLLQRADIVISSTAAPGFIVDKKLMSRVVRARRYKPILLIDLAVPRDIDPAVADLENCFVYDVDDLDAAVEDNRAARAKEAQAAEKIVELEVQGFTRWARSQQVVPAIKALRAKAMEIAEAEASRTIGSLPPEDAKVAQRVRAMSQAIVNKMLHPALARLKAEGADGDPGPLVDALERLFDLDLAAAARAERAEEEKEASNVVPFVKDGSA